MMTPSESKSFESPAPDAPEPAKPDLTSDSFRDYAAKLSALPTPEEKIALGLEFMRETISQEGSPRFREFWEARRDLLPLFKQNINSAIRSKLWQDYVDLTVEARRLKEILEEQSSFAIEQIDLALAALEEDINHFDKVLESSPQLVIPAEARSIQPKAEVYQKIQRELDVFNTCASRLNALRKEIIKTEMRIRFKTKFFKRMSELGDRIFPRRKELIEQIGAEFERDVAEFQESHFRGDEVVGAPFYALREEIKALQGFAKSLTLNTAVFTKTRLQLSECWDKIKVLEKAHKQETQQKKQAFSEARIKIEAQIEEVKKQIEGMTLKQLDTALDDVQKAMQAASLDRDDIRAIRQEMGRLRAPFLEKEEQRRKELEQAERERLEQKKVKANALKERIQTLQKDTEKGADELSYELNQIRQEIEELSLGKFEQQQFDRLLRPANDLIAERKESALLNLSDDEKNAIEQLREVLSQRKARRQEIKEQLENFRKMLGGSNLDFAKAMTVREQMDQEKERLEKANSGIQEIERKIAEIEEKYQ